MATLSIDVFSVAAVVFDIDAVLNDSPDAACFCDPLDAICLCFDGLVISSSDESVDKSHENSSVVDKEIGSKEKSEISDLSPESCVFFHMVPPGDSS